MEASVSTKRASELLGVHESSVKRWCNAGDIECWTTQGGHRRIPVNALVGYAREANLDCSIVQFADAAAPVWVGLEAAKSHDRFDALIEVLLAWTHSGSGGLILRLLDFLSSEGFTTEKIMDELVVRAVGRFGREYAEGRLSIGTEHQITHVIRDVLVSWSLQKRHQGSPISEPDKVAIVGCARGEVHELGSLMVRLALEQKGWKVVYLGLHVPTEEFSDLQIKHNASLVCVSMTSPSGRADVQTVVGLLNRMYAPSKPYRLAVGGTAVRPEDKVAIGKTSFVDIEYFTALQPFSKWVSG